MISRVALLVVTLAWLDAGIAAPLAAPAAGPAAAAAQTAAPAQPIAPPTAAEPMTSPAQDPAPALGERAAPPRTLRAHWHVFIAFAVTWLLFFGYVISLGRRWARLERELGAWRRETTPS